MQYLRAFVLSAAFGVVVLSALALYGDLPRLAAVAAAYPLPLLAPVLVLTAANYALRWLKWRLYLRLVGVPALSTSESVLIFLSGFAMGLTPGKVGEMVKPYLLRERHAVPMSRTAPILLAERLTDGIALIALAGAGLVLYGNGAALLAVLLLVGVAAVAGLRSPRLVAALIRRAEALPLLGRRVDALEAMVASAAVLLAWRPLLFAIALGFISWGCEALAFALVLTGLGVPAGPLLALQAAFALATATLFGSASLLPGGLGVAEASLTGFLQLVVGLEKSSAVYATLVIRLCTLWFGVVLGSVALLTLMARRRVSTTTERGAQSRAIGPR
jgi:uncharacterized protein (TIRG00374 family)